MLLQKMRWQLNYQLCPRQVRVISFLHQTVCVPNSNTCLHKWSKHSSQNMNIKCYGFKLNKSMHIKCYGFSLFFKDVDPLLQGTKQMNNHSLLFSPFCIKKTASKRRCSKAAKLCPHILLTLLAQAGFETKQKGIRNLESPNSSNQPFSWLKMSSMAICQTKQVVCRK